MTKQDFIFSSGRRHQLARHVVFWALWCLAFNLLFHFPVHVFKGWDVSGPGTRNLQELGLPRFFIKTLIINCLLAVILPQILLTYALLYWLLPNYYYKRRNYLLTGAITAAVLVVFYFVATLFKYTVPVYNSLIGTSPVNVPFASMRWAVMIDQLSSLPIILGFALMIKLVKRWWLKQKETQQLEKEKINAELQLLKAQVHPHFLFNTINNIYYFTLNNSVYAPVMIKKLSDLLHYILYECDQPLVPLEKEIKMIQDYMALEKIRYAEHMQMTVDIEDTYRGKMIAPLLLLPFVENSFKHGASKMITQPWVKLHIKMDNNRLRFSIINSKPPASEPVMAKGNIGLKNVKKRLELLYPGTHQLNIVSEPGSYSVYLDLQVQDIHDSLTTTPDLKSMRKYAMA